MSWPLARDSWDRKTSLAQRAKTYSNRIGELSLCVKAQVMAPHGRCNKFSTVQPWTTQGFLCLLEF